MLLNSKALLKNYKSVVSLGSLALIFFFVFLTSVCIKPSVGPLVSVSAVASVGAS